MSLYQIIISFDLFEILSTILISFFQSKFKTLSHIFTVLSHGRFMNKMHYEWIKQFFPLQTVSWKVDFFTLLIKLVTEIY